MNMRKKPADRVGAGCIVMRKLRVAACILLICSSGAGAQDLNLNGYDSSTFSNLAVITGRLLGSGFCHTAGIHRFGGFDIGVKTMVGFVPDDMQAGPLSGAAVVPIPALQVNVGLFNTIEAGGRLFSFNYGKKNREQVNLSSGIVKFNVLSGLGLPDVTLYSAYSRLSGITDFSLQTITAGGTAGFGIPLIYVYAGAQVNFVTMDVNLAADNRLYPAGFSEKYKAEVNHFTAGLSLGLAPFTQVNAEYNYGEFSTVTLGLIFSVF